MDDPTTPAAPAALSEKLTATLSTANNQSPGWKTTEFWCHAAITAGIVLAAAEGSLPPKYAALCVVLSQSCYSLARGLAKQGNSN